MHGLRHGFSLALIYISIIMGGCCGEVKLRYEANAMKWKILQSCIHLGGLSEDVSNSLIKKGLDKRTNKEQPRGSVDILLQ